MSVTFQNILLVTIISLFGAAATIDLQCEFKFRKFTLVGNQYTCIVRNNPEIIDSNAIIDNIIGDPRDTITAISIKNANIHFIPSNLGDKLPNLVVLAITNSKLKVVHQNDLKSLTKLQFMNLDGNLIDELEDGLFDFNPELQMIWLYNNKIKKIGSSLFSNLRNLAGLDLSKNVCISKKFANYIKVNIGKSESLVPVALSQTMLTEIAEKCSANAVEVTQQIETTTTLSSDQIYQAKITNLESRLLEALLVNNKNQEALNAKKSSTNEVHDESSHEYDVNRTIFKLETDLKVEKARVVMLKEELTERESEIDSMSDDISKAHESLRRFEEEIRRNYAPLRSADRAEIRKLEVEKAKLRQKIRDLLILINQLKEESQTEILKAKEEIDGLKILLFKDETQEIEIDDNKLDESASNKDNIDEVAVPLSELKVDESTSRPSTNSDISSTEFRGTTEQSMEKSREALRQSKEQSTNQPKEQFSRHSTEEPSEQSTEYYEDNTKSESSESTKFDSTTEPSSDSRVQSYASTTDNINDITKSSPLESTQSTELDITTEETSGYSTSEDITETTTDADEIATYKTNNEEYFD